ncbi:DUF736 family protein [Caulobacter sp.]|uniref:Uncharacterized protein n=1 Tax=Caulobacter vibrioides TaxID=155892 RepID=A0A258D7R1_CAUVI|nr:DUF736 family protein [Caulobacter sp.]MBQ1562058.1 DUF736 family protein [Caulobacter sp.]OYX03422.1 MAG: hypothetical protein B7Z12_10245 [Caulobacter vibrioides]
MPRHAKCSAVRTCGRGAERGPDYRVFAGQTALGAAWKKARRSSNADLSVKLDDLGFGERSTPPWW